ncbi:codeine O-demethylase-like [Prunus avium]|uniref:Codeine O-demethylase-like n=1 Tax=Prunus avium TaxID=42229 RepID=A0A6P5TEW1_PRUAV|nr:codeine O-demethylase-like [Prunus avium]
MPDKVLGMTPHKDPTTITILMQEDNIPGLQVRQGREWVPVNPIPNTLVVNVGDTWSTGMYKSVEHRAVTSHSKARLSYVTGLSPHEDVEVEPFDHILVEATAGSLQAYKKVRYGDYRRQPLEKKIEGKQFIQMAKIES